MRGGRRRGEGRREGETCRGDREWERKRDGDENKDRDDSRIDREERRGREGVCAHGRGGRISLSLRQRVGVCAQRRGRRVEGCREREVIGADRQAKVHRLRWSPKRRHHRCLPDGPAPNRACPASTTPAHAPTLIHADTGARRHGLCRPVRSLQG